MPSLIHFAGNSSSSPGNRTRIRVKEDPETVVKQLSKSESGFGRFELANRPGEGIWVNRDQVISVNAAK